MLEKFPVFHKTAKEKRFLKFPYEILIEGISFSDFKDFQDFELNKIVGYKNFKGLYCNINSIFLNSSN